MNLRRVTEIFEENFAAGRELGASLSIWVEGWEVLSLARGHEDRQKSVPWTAQSAVLFWSATKGLAAACVLHACEKAGISLETRVAEIWPEFGAAGKEAVTLAQMLSHQAGLAVITEDVSVWDYAAVIHALEAQAPHWPLGTGHGYHPRTLGFLMDEVVRRITGGTPLGHYFRQHFAQPLALDLWIGADFAGASVFPAKGTPPKEDPFYRAFQTEGSLTARAFGSPRGLHSVASMNTPEARAACLPAFGGIGTASSLAKFYAMLAAGGALEGHTFFSSLRPMVTSLSEGQDLVLQIPTAFSAGFMRDPLGPDGKKLRRSFGPSLRAFGHPGAGGSLAFADPEHHVAFAYVMNQMEPGVLPNERSLRLVDALYDSLLQAH